MNIVMVTNTFTPHVGGVARSVAAFSEEYRRQGHRVLVVAPEFPGMPEDETGVVRIAALQNFNGSDFSVVLPVAGLLTEALDEFEPDIVHSHHPYLLGMTALRTARFRDLPLVFTHHTLYEQYTHYVPGDSPALKQFVIELASHYANLADRVFAPSESIAELLKARGVESPVTVVPTGVDHGRFSSGDGRRFRAEHGIPPGAFVAGHVGRLAPEKNLRFLAEALSAFMRGVPRAHVLVAGEGPSLAVMKEVFAEAGQGARVRFAGVLDHSELAGAYRAMDVFAFASKSETQGMVLTEAMAAGVPVVGLDASGVREVVRDGVNGRLLMHESVKGFAEALAGVAGLGPLAMDGLKRGALDTARQFSMPVTAKQALDNYRELLESTARSHDRAEDQWQRVIQLIKAEWDIVKGVAESAGAALGGEPMSARNNRSR